MRSAVRAELSAERRRRRLRGVLAATVSAAAVLLVGLTVWAPGDAGGGAVSVLWRRPGTRPAPVSAADGVVVRGATMYVWTRDGAVGHVSALDTATGRRRWRSAASSLGYLAADGNRVYCLAAGRRRSLAVMALNAADGTVAWVHSSEKPGRSWPACAPVAMPHHRVCWTSGRTLTMLDAVGGKVLWQRRLPGAGLLSAGAAVGDRLYVAGRGAVCCLDLRTGDRLWRKAFQCNELSFGRPLLAVDDEALYTVQGRRGGERELVALDRATHRTRWRRPVANATRLLAAGHRVFVRAGPVMAIDRATGRTAWTWPATGCGALTHQGETLHFVDSTGDGQLVGLDVMTGCKTFQINGLQSCDAFVCVGRAGYLRTRDGALYALSLGG